MSRYLFPLLGFVVLIILLAYGLKLDPREVPSPFINKQAPSFSLTQLHQPDKIFTPESMKGKVWLLNVWASWCVSCRQEHHLLVGLSKSRQVPIYGLNYKDQRINAIEWLKKWGNPYQSSAYDEDGSAGIDWGVYGVPETFIIDKQGIIRHKHVGVIQQQDLQEIIMPMVKKLQAAG